MPDDPYVYPGTSVLRNRLGIRNPDRLAQVESEWSFVRLVELLHHPEPGSYDLAHLSRFHRRIFGDVYPWAGEIRTVAMAKGQLFALPQHITSYASTLFEQLGGESHIAGLERANFVARLAFYFAEINALHPFREGNGRAQRAFLKQLGRQAGWDIEWRATTLDGNLDASIAAMNSDLGTVAATLDRLVRRWSASP